MSFIGQPGVVRYIGDEKLLNNASDRNENFIVVGMSKKASKSVNDQGMIAINKKAEEFWKLMNTKDLKKAHKALDDPFFLETKVYVHPLGMMSLGAHLMRQLRLNPRVFFKVKFYYSNLNNDLFKRYTKFKLKTCLASKNLKLKENPPSKITIKGPMEVLTIKSDQNGRNVSRSRLLKEEELSPIEEGSTQYIIDSTGRFYVKTKYKLVESILSRLSNYRIKKIALFNIDGDKHYNYFITKRNHLLEHIDGEYIIIDKLPSDLGDIKNIKTGKNKFSFEIEDLKGNIFQIVSDDDRGWLKHNGLTQFISSDLTKLNPEKLKNDQSLLLDHSSKISNLLIYALKDDGRVFYIKKGKFVESIMSKETGIRFKSINYYHTQKENTLFLLAENGDVYFKDKGKNLKKSIRQAPDGIKINKFVKRKDGKMAISDSEDNIWVWNSNQYVKQQ